MGTSLLEQFLHNLEICQNSVTHGLKERISEDLSICKAGDKFHQGMRKCVKRKQLLQFEKSYRLAFYGI